MMHMPDFLLNQHASFEELEFCALDAAALSQIAMLHLDGIARAADPATDTGKIGENDWIRFTDMLKAERFTNMVSNVLDKGKAMTALYGVAASPRYRGMRTVCFQYAFDEDPCTQFEAVAFVQKGLFTCIAYQGTDDTIVGWREDFDMGCQKQVPSQRLASEFLRYVASMDGLPKDIFVVGHSKGGNLAEYAALSASSDIKARIKRVYDLDGPGFKEGTFTDEDYEPLKGKITKIVPAESLVGIILETKVEMQIAISSAVGLDQHSTFTWQVNGELNDFDRLPTLPAETRATLVSLREWLADYDDEQRTRLVDALFEAIEVSHARTPIDMLNDGAKSVAYMIEAAAKMDPDLRADLLVAVANFVKKYSQNSKSIRGTAASIATNLLEHLQPRSDG